MPSAVIAITPWSFCPTQTFILVFSARDKSERAFGVSFVKLMNINGTTLQDGRHDLVVYKVVLKKEAEDFRTPSESDSENSF